MLASPLINFTVVRQSTQRRRSLESYVTRPRQRIRNAFVSLNYCHRPKCQATESRGVITDHQHPAFWLYLLLLSWVMSVEPCLLKMVLPNQTAFIITLQEDPFSLAQDRHTPDEGSATMWGHFSFRFSSHFPLCSRCSSRGRMGCLQLGRLVIWFQTPVEYD